MQMLPIMVQPAPGREPSSVFGTEFAFSGTAARWDAVLRVACDRGLCGCHVLEHSLGGYRHHLSCDIGTERVNLDGEPLH